MIPYCESLTSELVPSTLVTELLSGSKIRGYRWWKTADFSHSAGAARSQRTVRPLGLGLGGTLVPRRVAAAALNRQRLPLRVHEATRVEPLPSSQ